MRALCQHQRHIKPDADTRRHYPRPDKHRRDVKTEREICTAQLINVYDRGEAHSSREREVVAVGSAVGGGRRRLRSSVKGGKKTREGNTNLLYYCCHTRSGNEVIILCVMTHKKATPSRASCCRRLHVFARGFAFTARVSVAKLQLARGRTRHTDEAKVKATDDHGDALEENKKTKNGMKEVPR